MKKDYLLLIGVGVLSGIVNALPISIKTFDFIGFPLQFMVYYAGIPYGFITAIYFISVLPVTKKFLRLVAWIIASAASYAIAVRATLMFAPHSSWVAQPRAIDYTFGGLVGALVLTITFHFIFRKMGMPWHFAVIVAGAMIPLVLFSLPETINIPGVLYIVWQTAITTILGSSFLSEKAKSTS